MIALRPENERGGYYFISLATGKRLHAFIWTELPINYQVISRVNDFPTKDKQLEMTKGYPIFEWSPGIPIEDKDDETKSEEDEIYSTHRDRHDDNITEKDDETQSEEDEISSTHEDEHDDDITENGEDE